MDSIIYEYWGKAGTDPDTYHLLPYHCLDVAAVGDAILRENPILLHQFTSRLGISDDDFIRYSSFFQSLHDLGKFSAIFQSKRPDLKRRLSGSSQIMDGYLRHDTLGAYIWVKDTEQFALDTGILKPERPARRIYQPWLFSVFGHHGIPPELSRIQDLDPAYLFCDHDLHACKTFTAETARLFSPSSVSGLLDNPKQTAYHSRCLSWVYAGLTVIADWIGSDNRFFPFCAEIMPLDEYWEKYALPRAKQALNNTRLIAPPVSADTGISHLFDAFDPSQTNPFTPSDLQQYASEFSPGPGPHLFIIEEATGSGKTEAAITLAHALMAAGQADGLYFALPTMATANSMYRRVEGMYRRLYDDAHPSLVLAHSARDLLEFFSPGPTSEAGDQLEEGATDAAHWLYDNRKKALLAHVGVGTIDQALLGILPLRHQSIRLFGLSTHVLIVDEVHAYDPYMNELLSQVIQYRAYLGESTILLSATLPKKERERFVKMFGRGAGLEPPSLTSNDYPLITHFHAGDSGTVEEISVSPRQVGRRSVAVEFVHSMDEVISIIESATMNGQCVCWVRNTVGDALDAHDRLGGLIDSDHLHLFHARFALGHRLDREDQILTYFGKESTKNERAGRVCIATQVVEQSLDIDFDVMITDLAPIDLIIQRAGRLHRHHREGRDDPVLSVFSPPLDDDPDRDWYSSQFPGGAYVYPLHVTLWRTVGALSQAREIISPDAHSSGNLRSLIEGVFNEEGADNIPESLRKRDQSALNDIKEQRSKALINALPLRSGYNESEGRWGRGQDAPTRLSIPSVTLRLGVIDQSTGEIHPLCGQGRRSWDLSSVTVAMYRIDGGLEYPADIEEKIEFAKRSMPDRGKFSTLLPLYQDREGRWSAEISTVQGNRLRCIYTMESGLILERV